MEVRRLKLSKPDVPESWDPAREFTDMPEESLFSLFELALAVVDIVVCIVMYCIS